MEAAYEVNKFKPERKRMRTAKNDHVETALIRWIREVRCRNMILTGAILQEKARFFADALGILEVRLDGFKGSRIEMESFYRRFLDRVLVLFLMQQMHF